MKGRSWAFSVLLSCTVAAAVLAEPNISVLWKKDIARADKYIKPCAIEIDKDGGAVRVIAVSYTYDIENKPNIKGAELFEYRLDLNNDTSGITALMPMKDGDITVILPHGGVLDSCLLDGNIMIIRCQYRSLDFQEQVIGIDGKVKLRQIPGLTRNSATTHGACRNLGGEVFLCGNLGYIRKVRSDGNVAWDVNYKSERGEDGALGVAFSESEKELIAFGFSFEPDTKFTTKDSGLWLARLDNEGNFKAKLQFEGAVNLGKNPSFCLSSSDEPVVIHDKNPEIGSCSIYVSRFSRDLKLKTSAACIFEATKTMVLGMSLIPFANGDMLAAFETMATEASEFGFHFYILNSKGEVINRALFKDITDSNYIAAVLEDKIFLASTEMHIDNDKRNNIGKLTCFKIAAD